MVLVVNRAYPALRIRKTRGIKLVRTPLVFLPVKPVLHNVIKRNAAGAEAFQNVQTLLLRFVPLAALPHAKGPERHHGGLTSNPPITGNNLIDLGSVDKIIIDVVT